MWTAPTNEIDELTQGAPYLIHYYQGSTPSSRSYVGKHLPAHGKKKDCEKGEWLFFRVQGLVMLSSF